MELKAVIFDLDGVITKTAKVHAAAWKAMFDEYLRLHEERGGDPFREFTTADYLKYVDGKPRYKGVASFLESRGIELPFGDPADPEDAETVCGLGNRKNTKFVEVLNTKGVEEYGSTVALIKDLLTAGIKVGVASSSKNCQLVLQKAGLEQYFETRVDGVVSYELGLSGKPEGDIFVKAAENLGCVPAESVVVEDAVSGVQAGRNGEFRLVIGVAREDNIKELQENGAHVVIEDFEGVTADTVKQWFAQQK
ncbi:MAG: beta-phosphoglucomutase family hydrolase [Candidatus Omnitrophica bacterium]|nr:beta-phosphoglucomutase family hydrolase [Candidatus Omnitrophota bacterium]